MVSRRTRIGRLFTKLSSKTMAALDNKDYEALRECERDMQWLLDNFDDLGMTKVYREMLKIELGVVKSNLENDMQITIGGIDACSLRKS